MNTLRQKEGKVSGYGKTSAKGQGEGKVFEDCGKGWEAG